jgi:hypothetical protein
LNSRLFPFFLELVLSSPPTSFLMHRSLMCVMSVCCTMP